MRILNFLLVIGVLAGVALAAGRADEDTSPSILQQGYPHAFFFRSAEGWAANEGISYERWEVCFSRLMGIEGKVLDEEVPGRSARNIDFFTRFKRNHPRQLVLLHYNGNARDPRYQTEKYFAGHWIYHNGATIIGDVEAEEGETEIRVSNPALFRVAIGRYRDKNEDVGLCMLDDRGRPDWHRSEQVQLLTIDRAKKTIRVRRACFGTNPLAFPAGRSYAAAHATEGPWGRRSNLMWFYNYSTRCPRNEQGRTCTDVHCDELAARFGTRGELAAFDGLEFDVLHHVVGGRARNRGPDCDADGRRDNGLFDGVNQYGSGVVEFCRQLREKLGADKIIQADGFSIRNQRAFGLLNGIESEGWPSLSDWQLADWSGGLNRHFYWQANARTPVFNYINHKFMGPGEKPGQRVRPQVPPGVHRLVFAVAVFTDSAVCYSFTPPNPQDQLVGIWDELCKGTENQLGWLGRPLGPPVRLAQRQADLLDGRGDPVSKKLLERLDGDGVEFELDNGRLEISTSDANQSELRFRLQGLPCDGPGLLVSVTARGRPMKGYPREVARLMWLGIAEPDRQSPNPKQTDAIRHMSWLGEGDFQSDFYFRDVNRKTVDLELTIEGPEPVWITAIRAHAHVDAIYRPFDGGLVLANPSPRPYTFDLGQLFPGEKFRRLRGSPQQDPQTNDGSAVEGKLTLGPLDGLFLIRRQR